MSKREQGYISIGKLIALSFIMIISILLVYYEISIEIGQTIIALIIIYFIFITYEDFWKKKIFSRIDNKKLGNIVFSALLIYFLFFGLLSIIHEEEPNNYLLFVYLNIFNESPKLEPILPPMLCILVLFIIGIIQSYREDFLFYSIRYNIWTVLIVIPLSIFWYSINYQISILEVIPLYFTSIHGYINIFVVELIYVSAGFVGAFLKSRKFDKMKQMSSLSNDIKENNKINKNNKRNNGEI